MKAKRVISIILMVVMVMSLMSGCGSGTESSKNESKNLVKFTLAYPTWIGFAFFNLAEEKGIFEKHGIAPKLTVIDDESQYAASIISGSVQAIAHVVDREIVNYSSGAKESVVVGIDESLGADGIVATSDIQSFEDLKGKTVAVGKSSASYFLLLTAFEENGIDPSEVNLVDMAPGDAGSAFIAGNVDAAVTWEPYLTNASEREGGHLLASSADFPNTVVDGVCFSKKFIEDNPEAVQAFVDAWYETLEYYEANQDESYEIMAKAMGISKEECIDMMNGVNMLDKEENLQIFDKSNESSIYELTDRASQFWITNGMMKNAVTSDAFVNGDFYKGSN